MSIWRVGTWPRSVRWSVAGVAIVILALGIVYLTEELTEFTHMPDRFDVVDAGKFYRSGQPDGQMLRNACRKYKIKTILLLRDEDYPEKDAEYRVAAHRGAKVIRIAMSSKELPDSILAELREIYRDPKNYPILAHCEHGVARTGVAVALWRIEQDGWTGERAVQEMIAHGYPVDEKNAAMRDRLEKWGEKTTIPGASTE